MYLNHIFFLTIPAKFFQCENLLIESEFKFQFMHVFIVFFNCLTTVLNNEI